MRKSSCWMVLVALLTVIVPTACADTIVTGSFGSVTAIDGINIAGTTYNVTFGTTDDTTFAGSFNAILARDLLANDLAPFLNVSTATNPFVNLIGVDGGGTVFTSGFIFAPGTFAPKFNGSQTGPAFSNFVANGPAAFAEFAPIAPTAAPEPSSLLLLGTGLLGLVGAMRRKRLA